MFLQKTLQRNPDLIRYSIELHRSGRIWPDTYVIDLDAVAENAGFILDEAKRLGIELFIMTKQFGRNPVVAAELIRLGYEGAVAVDFKEAVTLDENGIPLGHVGHLVQVPSSLVDRVIAMRPRFITVYSLEKAVEINEACRKIGVIQPVLLRIVDREDVLYDAQYGGFAMSELQDHVDELLKLGHVKIAGVTSFPCFLYRVELDEIMPTNNVKTLQTAVRLLRERFGISVEHVNMPSATCTYSIRKIHESGGTHGEPGHGLLGTTPMHAVHDLPERPAMVYVSEISHIFRDKSYCYGGGLYRRSAIRQALVVDSAAGYRFVQVNRSSPDAIDYHIEMEGHYPVGQCVIMAFRAQVFETRSYVAVVKGLSKGAPELIGLFDSQGRSLRSLES